MVQERLDDTEVRGDYPLPEGWRWVRLGDVCKINPSKREIKGAPLDMDVSFIPMSYIDDRWGCIIKYDVRQLAEVNKSYTYFRDNDILFAKITPCMENGKCAIAQGLMNGLGFGSTEFHVIRASQELIPEWGWYYLRQKRIREEAKKYFAGSAGQQRVPKEFLEKLKIPLPPPRRAKAHCGKAE